MCVPHTYYLGMTTTSERTLRTTLEIKSWDEKPYREFDDGRKFTRAEVQLGSNDGIESAAFEALMFYRPDGTCSDVSLMQITATFEGKTGSFVLRGSGEYDGTTAGRISDRRGGWRPCRHLRHTDQRLDPAGLPQHAHHPDLPTLIGAALQ